MPRKKNVIVIQPDMTVEKDILIDTDESKPLLGTKTPNLQMVQNREVERLRRKYGGNPTVVDTNAGDKSEVV